MNILLLSSHFYNQDAVLMELINVCKMIGNTKIITYSTEEYNLGYLTNVLLKNRQKALTAFGLIKHIVKAINLMLKINVDILFIDDFTSSITAYILCKIFKIKMVVLFSRELYIDVKMPGFGKYFVKYERIMYNKADIIIACNVKRAEIMQDYYKLETTPFVFENIRNLDVKYDKIAMDIKYANFFNAKINIIATGGVSLERGTERLIRAMTFFPDYDLYIIGKGKNDSYEHVVAVIHELHLDNVYILDRVILSELKYLVTRSDIGIVEYHQKNLNNIYCASGKIYEYLFEGLPVVTTENYSLKYMCEQYNIGVADNNFIDGIRKVADNLYLYKKAVKEYIMNISVLENNIKLAEFIKFIYNKKYLKNR